jgi:site-specific DNA recombinase
LYISTTTIRPACANTCPRSGTGPARGAKPAPDHVALVVPVVFFQSSKSNSAASITRVQKGADRLLDAYQEGLLSLEQLRRRMPEIRKRESALRAELQTVEASVVDRERCLRLVGNLKGFLSSLHRSAQTLDVKDRQRVLRLVVKEILVGPDTLTVKHSIPVSSRAGDSSADSEGQSYLLRGWSHNRALWRSLIPPR